MFEKALIIGGLNWIACSYGFIFGQTAGMVGSLRKHEEGIELSESQISLIISTTSMSCPIGFALAAFVSDKLGRRWPIILFSIPAVMNWIILYNAKEMYQFILSRVLGGISVGVLLTLTILITSEYTSPKTRAFFLNMVTTVAPAIGTGFGHAAGIVLHWRTTALIGLFLSAIGIVLPYFWEESPHWLASKGKFDKCEKVFRILHKNTTNSGRELQLLIKMEECKLKETNLTKSTLKILCIAFKRQYFWGLLIMSFCIQVYFVAAGKLIFEVLATVLLKEITGTSDVLLFTILIDGFIIVGSSMSCVLIRRTSMRTLLFTTGFTGNIVLVLFSVCFYFKNGQSYFDWINVILLAIYFILVNAGPYPILDAIISEMFPLELKVYAYFISGVILIASLTSAITLLPYALSLMGYHGLFLTNAAIMSLCLVYIWLKLPETKGKTLQEIEMYFKTNNFDVDKILSNEQSCNF